MKPVWFLRLLVFFSLGAFSCGANTNATSRPSSVNIGAIFTMNSTIGRVAKIAIETAVDDINADSSILNGIQLNVKMRDSNCSGFLGIVDAFEFMETNILAVVGPQSSVIAHVISHVANELKVPLLSFAATDPTLSSLQYPFFVRTTHSDLFQMTAIAEILDFYQWKQVIAIFIDDDYGRNGIAALGDRLAERRGKISFKVPIRPGPGLSKNEITDILIRVALMESHVIVIHANPDSGLQILSVAHYLGMLSGGYVWIATDWLSSVLDSWDPLSEHTTGTMQGLITLRLHTEESKEKRAFTSRWSKLVGDRKATASGLNSYGLYAYDTIWIVAHAIDTFFKNGGMVSFSNDSRLLNSRGGSLRLEAMTIFDGGDQLLKNIYQTNLIGVSGLLQFGADHSLIHPAFNIINVVGTGYRSVGYWSNYSGLSIVPPETLYEKPPNRSSANQQLKNVIWPGETIVVPRGWVFPNNGKELRIGVPVRVGFRDFVAIVPGTDMVKGFCIDIFTAAVSLLPYAVPYNFIPFGNGRENPSYTELVYRITTGEFDAVVGDISIVTNRTKILDFTQPYIESGLVILAPVRKLNSSAWAFLKPFTLEMWLVTAVFFLVVGAVVWILEHRMNDDFRGPPKKQFITILCYTASLTSILTVQQLSSAIKGIDNLITSGWNIGFQVGSFAESYMIEELGIPKSRLIALGSPEEYALALSNGTVAAIVDEFPYVQVFLSTQCKFKIVGQEFTRSGWGFAFPRDSNLAVDMSTAILTLSENGDLQRIHDKWLTRSACSSQSTELESNYLQLKSFWGLFLICGIACFVALLIYFVLTVRQFNRHCPDELQSSNEGGSSQSRRVQNFLSFVDEKEESVKSKSKRRQMEKMNSMDTNASMSPH
ncbi:hypothetical protein ACLOJK_018376 [Asimina triloba]